MSEKRIKVVMTPAGKAWDAEKEYRLLDYISDGLRMWLSVKVDPETGVNRGHALTDAAWWSACVDMSEALTVAEEARTKAAEAADKANAAAQSANAAADTANGAAAKADAATTAANSATSAANAAASAANTAASNANAKAAEASKVNAIITEENVLEVTDRTGAKKTLSLVTPAQAEETAAKVEELDAAVKAFVDRDAYVGFYRENGDASPDAEVTYGSRERMKEIGAEWKLATVKNGKITHIMAPGRLTLDVDGNEVKINGEDGDVMLINRNCYLLKDTKEVEGRELNIIGIGNRPGVWMGTPTKHIPAFGMTPCETVNGKIFDDVREQAHCVYNTDIKSRTFAPSGLFVQSYKKAGGGYASSLLSSADSIRYAQAKNEDALTARPYMGWYYETYEALLATMFAELGSLCHTELTQFGSGSTNNPEFTAKTYNDEQISGIAGYKIIKKDGTDVFFSLFSYVKKDSSGVRLNSGVDGNLIPLIEMFEGQRVLDGIAKAGLTDIIGDKSHIFYYTEDGGVACVEDGSVNIDTGEGMEMLKKYYIVRSVPGCEGMADGVMTAVVNRYVRMEMAEGVTTTDDGTDLSGATVLMKLSIPIYRGFELPLCGMARNMAYAHLMLSGTQTDYKAYFFSFPRIEDVQPLTDFSKNACVSYSESQKPPIVSGMEAHPVTTHNAEWWIKSGQYALSFFFSSKNGGSRFSCENAYVWSYAPSRLAADRFSHMVFSSTVGTIAYLSIVSARLFGCSHVMSSVDGYFAGAFAVLLDQ